MAKSKYLSAEPLGLIRMPTWVVEEHPGIFGCEADGGGMSRVIPDGAIVMVEPCEEPENGDIVAVELPDGEPYLRRWHRGQSTLLLSADGYEEREDMVFRGAEIDSVIVLGKVLGCFNWFV